MGPVAVWAGAVLLAVIGGGCSPSPKGGTIEGRVIWEGKGIAAALVGAYPKAEQDPSVPPAAEAATGSDGSFRIELPPGRYWVWARATVETGGRGARLVGQARPTPLDVIAGRTIRGEVSLSDPSGFSSSAGTPGAGVMGKVEVGRGGKGKVVVYAYPGRAERPTGPGFVAAKPTASDGSFRLDLKPGTYTVAARWRASGDDSGDLTPGDRTAAVPVEVAAGRYSDAGSLRLHPVDRTVRQHMTRGSPRTATSVLGRIHAEDGRPVNGVRILAFRDPRMAGKPLALSAPSGSDGRFSLFLPGGGTYYLGARSRLGGPAEPGERVGAYRGETGAGLVVREGQVVGGVEISVEEVW
ncbi:MAG: hypothetical protein HY900_12155 [Deltaproteobacteria bacterium]|nr:hypothetical protein [Deltaproteobacteria bacterium]